MIFTLLLLLAAETTPAETSLICCGAEEVFVLTSGEDDEGKWRRSWSWRASDSKDLPEESHAWFGGTDECKPFGDQILITSSSGGVALIRRRDKQCLFYARAKNAHSACLLPENRIAVASSFGGDEVLVLDIPADEVKESKPISRLPLVGAHGVMWDAKRNRLWALGEDDLLLVEFTDTGGELALKVDSKWKLPSRGGHDLSQPRDANEFLITTNSHVYRFDKTEATFRPHAKLGDEESVKSVSVHPESGETVYHQGKDGNWWSHTIQFVGKRPAIELPEERLYKIRWDTPGE